MRLSHRPAAAVLAIAVLLSGCATSMQPVPKGADLSFAVARNAVAENDAKVHNNVTGGWAGKGALIGGLAGGAIGLAIGGTGIVPGLAVGAALGGFGALTGTAAGVGAGLSASVSSEQEGRLQARMRSALQRGELSESLQRQFTGRAAGQWTLGAASPAYNVTVIPQEVMLLSDRDARISLYVRVQATVTPGAAVREAGRSKSYEYNGTPSELGGWLDEGSTRLKNAMDDAGRQLASEIATDLGGR